MLLRWKLNGVSKSSMSSAEKVCAMRERDAKLWHSASAADREPFLSKVGVVDGYANLRDAQAAFRRAKSHAAHAATGVRRKEGKLPEIIFETVLM